MLKIRRGAHNTKKWTNSHLLNIVEAPARLHGKEHHLVPARANRLARGVGRDARHSLLLQRIELQPSSVGLFTRVPVFVYKVKNVRNLAVRVFKTPGFGWARGG